MIKNFVQDMKMQSHLAAAEPKLIASELNVVPRTTKKLLLAFEDSSRLAAGSFKTWLYWLSLREYGSQHLLCPTFVL